MTKLICEEGLKAGFEMAEKKIREYPNCMELIYSLNTCLDGSLILYSANETEEELKIYQNKIIAYYEFIVSRAEEGRTREGAVYMLAGKYMNMERYDEAEEILKTLPERPADRRVLQAKLLANRGRVSEAAELLELFQWSAEDVRCEEKKDKIREELADVLNYCILMADTCGLDMDEIIQEKIKKNAEKYPVEKAYGHKEKYTEL